MEIDITEFWRGECPSDYSASAAEIGPDAGRDTWQAATENAPAYAHWLGTDDRREEFRDWVESSGGWTREEIDKWSDLEMTALLMQWVAGDIREGFGLRFGARPDAADWAEYERDTEAGLVPGRLYRGGDGRIYFHVGD